MIDSQRTRHEAQGERVTLRPTRAADAAVLFPLVHRRADVLDWVCWNGPDDLDAYARELEAGGERSFAIEVAGRAIGTLRLDFEGHPGTADLGYWIGAPARGRGYATEAIALAAGLAFRELSADGLVASVFVGNEPSRRALERNGFRLVRTLESLHELPAREGDARARNVDEWQFALLAGTWRRSAGKKEAVDSSLPLEP